jgi:hypothetical protein
MPPDPFDRQALPVQPESSGFEWDNGLQSAKAWSLELMACKAKGLTPTMKMVGWVLREHGHMRDGTVYLSSGKMAELLNRNEDNVKKDRAALQNAGWFEFTGEYRMHAMSQNAMKVWRFTVPSCSCGAHTP